MTPVVDTLCARCCGKLWGQDTHTYTQTQIHTHTTRKTNSWIQHIYSKDADEQPEENNTITIISEGYINNWKKPTSILNSMFSWLGAMTETSPGRRTQR